jgi:hypothetical protein
MKLYTAIAAVFLFTGSLFSQTVTFDTVYTNRFDSLSFYLKNPTTTQLNINNIRTISSQFFIRRTQFTINSSDSIKLYVVFRTNQNITYNDFLIFESTSPESPLKYSLIVSLTGTAKYTDALYNFTQGLRDEELKLALKNYVTNGAIVLGYTTARDRMYETIDDYENNDTLTCVYTGRRAYVPNRPSAGNVNFNTEHTYPQSFFGSADPMVSDIHHLFPTDDNANNKRANYDFGWVVNSTWDSAGSRLGTDQDGQIVFEARNAHKGNVARALFYFLIRHTNLGGYMDQKQENALRQWNVIDTVDARERIRNDRVKLYQNNRNPFCDHPEFIDRIRSTFLTAPTLIKPEITASPFTIEYDTLARNDTATYSLAILNYGRASLNINGITSSNPVFSVVSFPAVIAANSYGYAKIKFRPDANNQTFTGTLLIDNNDSLINVNIRGYSNASTGIIVQSTKIPGEFSLKQNYPNPFNPVTTISFDIAKLSNVKLLVFDITGREVMTLVNNKLNPGSYKTDLNASVLGSGTYYYRLEAGNFVQTRKMILIK